MVELFDENQAADAFNGLPVDIDLTRTFRQQDPSVKLEFTKWLNALADRILRTRALLDPGLVRLTTDFEQPRQSPLAWAIFSQGEQLSLTDDWKAADPRSGPDDGRIVYPLWASDGFPFSEPPKDWRPQVVRMKSVSKPAIITGAQKARESLEHFAGHSIDIDDDALRLFAEAWNIRDDPHPKQPTDGDLMRRAYKRVYGATPPWLVDSDAFASEFLRLLRERDLPSCESEVPEATEESEE